MDRAAALLRPTEITCDALRHRKRDAELDGQIRPSLTGCVSPPNLCRFDRMALGVRDGDSVTVATLGNAVPHVVGHGAKEKVSRIDTRRVVAAVANVQSVRDGAVVDFPRESVSSKYPFGRGRHDLTIPVRIGTSGPQPTRIGLVDVAPEPLFQISLRVIATCLHRALARTVLVKPTVNVALVEAKAFTTDGALNCDRRTVLFGRLRAHLLTPFQWVPRPGRWQSRPGISSPLFYQMGAAK